MSAIKHIGGKFVADCPFGQVERMTEYPHFVYHHPDGRTARHLIEERAPGRQNHSSVVSVDADGVRIHGIPCGDVVFYPWS